MTTYPCPNGHSSETPDYCSECGKRLSAALIDTSAALSAGSFAPPAGVGSDTVCPDCGTQRGSATAVFCEVCRYNFVEHRSWSPTAPAAVPAAPAPVLPTPPVAVAAPAPFGSVATPAPTADSALAPSPVGPPDLSAPVASAPSPAAAPLAPDPLRRWEAVVAVDPSLYIDPDPTVPCPVGEPERVFPLDFAENLIGRRSERRAIYPEIDLSTDHGVSARHAVLYRESDGSISLLDVGSTNGTRLNGADLPAGRRTPLRDGDQVTLGCWTRLKVRCIDRVAAAGAQP